VGCRDIFIAVKKLKMFFANFGLFKQFQVVENVGKGRKKRISMDSKTLLGWSWVAEKREN
jgi:ABC-type polar amino acid transport system ATPase subunit